MPSCSAAWPRSPSSPNAPFITSITSDAFTDRRNPPHPLMAQALEALRELPEASHLALLAPRFMLRHPYGKKSDPISAFTFEEFTPEEGLRGMLWGHPALLAATVLAAPSGNTLSVGDLPFHYVVDGDGDQVALPTTERLVNLAGGRDAAPGRHRRADGAQGPAGAAHRGARHGQRRADRRLARHGQAGRTDVVQHVATGQDDGSRRGQAGQGRRQEEGGDGRRRGDRRRRAAIRRRATTATARAPTAAPTRASTICWRAWATTAAAPSRAATRRARRKRRRRTPRWIPTWPSC